MTSTTIPTTRRIRWYRRAGRITTLLLVTTAPALILVAGCGPKAEATASAATPTGKRQLGAGEDGKIHVMHGSARRHSGQPTRH